MNEQIKLSTKYVFIIDGVKLAIGALGVWRKDKNSSAHEDILLLSDALLTQFSIR